MAQNFKVMSGKERVTVSVDADTISATTSNGRWVFSRHTKLPTTFERPAQQGAPLSYSVDTSLVSSQGLGAITATDDNGVTIPRGANGVGSLPVMLDAIQKAASQSGFPPDAKALIPDLYKNIGQPVPQRSGP